MTVDVQWHRIRFSRDELASGAMSRFLVDSLLPAIEELGDVDLRTVAIFDVDDSEAAKDLYLSPVAFVAFLALALAHGAQPCDRLAPQAHLYFCGDVLAAPKLLVR